MPNIDNFESHRQIKEELKWVCYVYIAIVVVVVVIAHIVGMEILKMNSVRSSYNQLGILSLLFRERDRKTKMKTEKLLQNNDRKPYHFNNWARWRSKSENGWCRYRRRERERERDSYMLNFKTERRFTSRNTYSIEYTKMVSIIRKLHWMAFGKTMCIILEFRKCSRRQWLTVL